MSSSDAGSVVLVGDSSRRVTVPMPRSLPELQYQANRNFARDRGQARMFHQGTSHMHHPHHIGKVRDGDVIVIEASQMPKQDTPNYTTHQVDYVEHPVQAREAPPQSQPPPPGAKFEGTTSYKNDYVKHPLGMRKPVAPPRGGILTHRPEEKTGKSMYTVHYPWHDVEPVKAAQPPPGVPLNQAPFEAITSYMNDYIKHPMRPRSATPTARPKMTAPLPFEATTTYNNDYQNFPSARTEPTKPLRATLRPDGHPFEGSSEYKREYIELKMEHRPMVHLEPEIRREPRAPKEQRSGSTPATPARARKFC